MHDLRRIVHTDALTQIGNRQFLERRLRGTFAEYINQEGTAGLLFIDIDNFKQFNDVYGHDVGDRVLRMVATTIKNSLRRTDLVGRWGGEEFIAILNDVNTSSLLESLSEKIRTLVQYSHLDVDGKILSVTISIGATLLRPNDTPESIIQRADKLMYQSKKSGRNNISIG